MDHPVQVVEDRGDEFAVLLSPGSEFTFYEHPEGTHPWAGQRAWRGPEVLQLYRVGLWYSVWMFFDETTFRNWYINFEAPVVRHREGFATDDYGLDLIVDTDQSMIWKDVEDLDAMLADGRLEPATVLGVLAAAREVAGLIRTGDRWWAPWDEWTPADLDA
ncbi:DUF402 domain-containing protein [Georgenia alba]|uniref:DUF402 domain-containing protein n=1 Tax=Georgenia alba TaxID=2233858 RepID=A0ABW2QD04_9MICO